MIAMKFDINEIKMKIGIPQLLARHGHEVGRKKMIRSPLREEKTASFSIHDDGKKFYDFGSGAHGDVIDLEMELTGCSKAEAIEKLAALAGVIAEDGDEFRSLPPMPQPPRHHAARRLGDFLPAEEAKAARHRLKRFLGLDDKSWPCTRTLAWLPPDDLKAVLKKGFLGADERGRLVYLMRRGMKVRTDPSASRGDRWIYGVAKDNALVSWLPEDTGPGGPDTVMFCEGESDSMAAIARWDDKVRVVGCLSCSIAPPMEVLYAMARNCSRAIIAFDGDEAGRNGSKALAALLQRVFPSLELFNYRTPDKMDLKKMALDGSISILDRLVSNQTD